jgi:hypothetical protein
MRRLTHHLLALLLTLAPYVGVVIDLASLRAMAQTQISAPVSIFTPPNLFVSCGKDATTALNAALAAAQFFGGVITPTPCPQSNPIKWSGTLMIPSNTVLACTAPGTTWFQEVSGSHLAPAIENANAGGGAGQLDSVLGIVNCSFDFNGSGSGSAQRGIYFLGVDQPVLQHVKTINCTSDCVYIDGNAAQVGNGTVDDLYAYNSTGGRGLEITHAQRGMTVANIHTINTNQDGIFIDASQGSYTNLIAENSGNNFSCANSGTSTVDNPGGGSTGQSGWTPCPAGIVLRNVTNITGGTWTASGNQYYGVLEWGVRYSAIESIASTNNSLSAIGVFDDIHYALSNTLSTGYGETHVTTQGPLVVGANGQTAVGGASSASPATSRYGVQIETGLPGSCGDYTIVSGGTGYAVGDTWSLVTTGGTEAENCKGTVTAISGVGATGPVTAVNRNTNGGSGVWTKLPPNPVSTTTNNSGAGLTLKINWSSAMIGPVTCGQTGSGCVNRPAMMQYWTVLETSNSSPANFFSCSATISGANTITPAGCGTMVSGNYSPPAQVTPNTWADFRALGGGGGGGYCNTTAQAGGAGGAGGLAEAMGTGLVLPGGSYAVTGPGSGGAGGTSGAAPTAGTATAIALETTTPTGNGGAAAANCTGAAQQNAGGTASGGLPALQRPGGPGISTSGATISQGGDVPYNYGTSGKIVGSGGALSSLAGTGYGAAGSGALVTGGNGGAGTQGAIFVHLEGG